MLLARADDAHDARGRIDASNAPIEVFPGIEAMIASAWTPERRARQAELIHTWRPWQASTGPRSAAGKARASRNACKPNSPRRQLMAMKGELAAVLRKLMRIEARRRAGHGG